MDDLPDTTASDHDWSSGPDDAAVTLVIYGDFECPQCGRAFRPLQLLREVEGDRLRFVFRHFPLRSVHKHAQAAAEAAEAAGAQGSFWEMHDLLYRHQAQLEDEDLRRYAAELGLDLDQFDHDLREHVYAAQVRAHVRWGARDGVNGTPTILINGRRYDGPIELSELSDAVQAALTNHGRR